jgi:hypothetical protein
MAVPVSNPVVAHDFAEPGEHWPLGHHTGRDYAAAVGTSVRATRAGEVASTGWDDVFGNHVVVATNGIRHVYAHLSEIATRAGASLETGELIGRSGSTGTTWPHLHYEERVSPYGTGDQRRPLFDDLPAAGETVWWQRLAFGGAESDSVRTLQRQLNHVVGARLPVTGRYLEQTRQAVAAFQRQQGWSHADGLIFDPRLGGGGQSTVALLFPSPPFAVVWRRPPFDEHPAPHPSPEQGENQ